MDTFIDKLAQKKNAQEMIRANSAAEAAKTEQMQNQLQAYDEMMREIRRVNIKTAENVENVRSLLAKCVEKLENADTENEAAQEQLAQIKTLLEERLTQSEEYMHRENVKVYRNVQAAFTEELGKQQDENRNTRSKGLPVGLSVAILIGVVIDIVINVISMLLPIMNIKLF